MLRQPRRGLSQDPAFVFMLSSSEFWHCVSDARSAMPKSTTGCYNYSMNKEKVLNLAKLARLEITSDEAESLAHEFEAILGYVGEVKKVAKSGKLNKFNKEEFSVRNIMREDGEAHEASIYTEKILSQAPAREGNYFKVKKIL